HVPRVTAYGGDGDRREGDAGRNGRGPDALDRERPLRPIGAFRRRRHRGGTALPVVLPAELDGDAAVGSLGRGPAASATGNARPRGRGASIQHAAIDRRRDRRRLLLRGQAALREGD